MLALKVVVLLLSLVHLVHLVNARTSSLVELIKRVHTESDKATFCLINFDEDFLTILLRGFPEIPVLILNDPETVDNELTSTILVVQAGLENEGLDDAMLDGLIGKLQARRDIIVCADSLINLEQYFSFFAEKMFTRILGIAADNLAYAYFPYADSKVRKLSQSGPLPQPLKDLNGFVLRTSMKQDMPRLFPYLDDKEQLQIGGSIGKIFVSFLEKHNATFREFMDTNSNLSITIYDIVKATALNKIDISMNAYLPEPSCGWSYPTKIVTCVIMVPVNGFVDPHEYFIRPFDFWVWFCIGLFLICVTLIKALLNKCLQKTPEYWQSFSETFSAMLMLSSEKSITHNYRLHIQIILFTFLIGNIYVIFFTSFMTAFIQIKQFNTMQDLIDNKVRILSTYFDKKYLIEAEVYPQSFLDLIVTVDIATYATETFSMKNTSFAYVVSNDRKDFLINMQSAQIKPLFRTAKEVLRISFISFFLPVHSQFKDILDDFIISSLETGLPLKWDSDAVYLIRKEGWAMEMNREAEESMHVPLNIHHLKFPLMVYAMGLIVGVLVFLGERFGKNLF